MQLMKANPKRPVKELFVDVGTVKGFGKVRNVAGIIRINGEVVDRFEAASPKGEQYIYSEVRSRLRDQLNVDDPKDRYYVIGYNVQCDMDLLQRLWKECGDQTLRRYFFYQLIDVYMLATMSTMGNRPEDLKLGTVLAYFGVPIRKEHDSLADVTATMNLYDMLVGGARGKDSYGMDVSKVQSNSLSNDCAMSM